MTTNTEAKNSNPLVKLAPNYRIPIVLLILGAGSLLVSLYLAVPIALLGLFLTVQTVLIRLEFTDQALNVLRSDKIIRSFPYSEWLNWEIFWQPVPILFYFKEVKSIHFLPIIFDPKTLLACLNEHCPRQTSN
ncbi:hypothetical protein NIES4102_30320 [Chondrocystis sp. NIES-4102]|nr:hypothetical protein NIES4102_30320 [Chondrocystis sp. NIES-4102]